MTETEETSYVKLHRSQIPYCKEHQVYLKLENRYVECNPNFLPGTWGVQLYIKSKDRVDLLRKVQEDFNKALEKADPVEIKSILSEMMLNTLSLPNPDILGVVGESFESFMDLVTEDQSILKKILRLSTGRYTTVEHSINTAALTINFCMATGYSEDRTYKQYGLAGLFHDIGKAYISEEILNSTKKLTDEEYKQIKTHPKLGERVLKISNFSKIVCMGAAEHHLKMDGSGYPSDQPPKGEIGKLLGIIDPFEALTNHSRLYKDPHSFEKACKILNSEVEMGKLDRPLYKEFVRSLKVKSCR